jgi:precorrin-6A/cobalt-precorrin-6A reductase
VDAIEQAVTAGAASRRPFLTTGRQSVEVFRAWSDKDVLLRVVDPPARPVPPRWRVIRSRGPYGYPDEYALMSAAGTDLLVTKDSGGSLTAAKLDAARDLGIQVLIVARPPAAAVPRVDTVAAALTWLDGLEPAAGG